MASAPTVAGARSGAATWLKFSLLAIVSVVLSEEAATAQASPVLVKFN
ncbi:hypothetical protein QUB68_22930 [Microcoleus sp. A006_D1]